MHIHVLGICGTFMGGVALLARAAGHQVTGSDTHTYPPMSDLLAREGIVVHEGYDLAQLNPAPDLVIIGNALSRGNPCVEAVLDRQIPYDSGPAWLSREILASRWVLAVAGTHGKTTTTSILTWILQEAGLNPGFLIGGEALNFGISARLTDSPFFVIEADEYDTAFFDKRSKFVHYHPRTLILNNLEYDHADIFPNLEAIITQFHHLLRTVPGKGALIVNAAAPALQQVLDKGCWTPVQRFSGGGDWQVQLESLDGRRFGIVEQGQRRGQVEWDTAGVFNAENALAAVLAARHAGVPIDVGIAALRSFRGVRRRLELRGTAAGVSVYDDFAHHPTAIAATIAALRGQMGASGRLIAVLEPRSNTMKLGIHQQTLADSLQGADRAFVFAPADIGWDVRAALAGTAQVSPDMDDLLQQILDELQAGDQVLVMSNGAFAGIHGRLLAALARRDAGITGEI
ncbi:UDP-N-acetylmuramate:L-alanyl-gamma-D-glutamyl-meso-diaminopimelate ligase [Acidithiobacillus concretivorus]|uniref:UDP-N-acetylmuramate--L-alanyl-gamma-D-glutamyl-meso-2,6-diaminoheptandioate ligase n=1 Tax=Acidithiobacillus concretivorus TaxID=3063952 RepID=A0ABS5ZP23_9PROT|nr:UDP-N-acetylmuramate:L-alanyl-gamma-D-glutamyl-meso-diaminopimelate ligase [Acidithiobacillus concretivorus]MBU2738346.1 UDP-N-acetylmuramate:L-alanyl-gamma-D-glutamyl-meso-diaminopimelate ligase [Acidithiobacillus concretivorus]